MFSDRFSSSTSCSRWLHETELGRLDHRTSETVRLIRLCCPVPIHWTDDPGVTLHIAHGPTPCLLRDPSNSYVSRAPAAPELQPTVPVRRSLCGLPHASADRRRRNGQETSGGSRPPSGLWPCAVLDARTHLDAFVSSFVRQVKMSSVRFGMKSVEQTGMEVGGNREATLVA